MKGRDYEEEMRGQLASARMVGNQRMVDLMTSALRRQNKADRREAEALCRYKWNVEEGDSP